MLNCLLPVLILLVSGVSTTALSHRSLGQEPATVLRTAARPIVIPFELVNRHIVLKVKVNDRPLSFVLDTGDRFGVIDIDRARALGLTLQGTVKMHGAGEQSMDGAWVKDAKFTVTGLEAFSQSLTLALPVARLSSRFGQDFDGIIGSEFIGQFVIEVDYETRTLKLFDKDQYNYAGNGEVVPIKLNAAGHPIIEAEVTPMGSAPVKGRFVVDLGSSLPLALYSPFVKEHQLLGPNLKTIKSVGGIGAGGETRGQIGRVSELSIGKFKIKQPITFFSEDQAGAFAISSVLGNIGAQIMNRFRVVLDYKRERIILEPNSLFGSPFDRAFSGFTLVAEGPDYRTFRIAQLLDNSPATDAQLQRNDVITAIDGKPLTELTLSVLNEMFERPVLYKLTVRRNDKTFTVNLTPRRLV